MYFGLLGLLPTKVSRKPGAKIQAVNQNILIKSPGKNINPTNGG
jgi:hypothetical protein